MSSPQRGVYTETHGDLSDFRRIDEDWDKALPQNDAEALL